MESKPTKRKIRKRFNRDLKRPSKSGTPLISDLKEDVKRLSKKILHMKRCGQRALELRVQLKRTMEHLLQAQKAPLEGRSPEVKLKKVALNVLGQVRRCSQEEIPLAQKRAHPSIIFICYDAGETLALLSVMNRLKDIGIPFKVLHMATASFVLEASTLPKDRLVPLDLELQRERLDPVPQEELDLLFREMHATVVVTGVVSYAQLQVAQGFQERGASILPYYDNPSWTVEGVACLNLVEGFDKIADSILVPSQKHRLSKKQKVVGHPTLDQWSSHLKSINSEALRQKFKISGEILTYIGGYGDGYIEAFERFITAYQKLKDPPSLILVLHPKVVASKNDPPEFKILENNGIDPMTVHFPALGTQEAVALAKLVVTRNSTVSTQALYAGRQVAFCDDKIPELAQLGLASYFTESHELQQILSQDHSPSDQARLKEALGIPQDACHSITEEILLLFD